MARSIVRSALVALAGTAFCGCTAIGWAIGRQTDKGKPPLQVPVAVADVDTLKPGQRIEVVLWDGRKLTGTYRGLVWAKPDEYAARYEEARKALAPSLELPALGPGARLTLTTGKFGTGRYLGLGPDFVWFHEPGAKEPEPVRLHRVASLTDGAGRTLSGERLKLLLGERRVPTLVSLAVEQPGEDAVVSHEQVAGLTRIDPVHSGRNTGLIIGAVLDVAVVVASAVALSQPWESDTSSTTTTSCPLLDSFDGREYVLDAEPLGGAFYAAAERTDAVRLDRIAAIDGEYRLRLRNDQWEIDHVDAVALRVVDHPPGTEVVPDASGRLLVVRGPTPPASGRLIPSSAPSRRDADITRLLASPDEEAWVSDLWGRDSRRPDHLRDGLELEFPLPAGARSAAFVARAGATAFGARVLREVLALNGRDLGVFYATLERGEAARAAFEDARRRDVLPQVRVLAGGEWRTAGTLRDLPSLVRRDQAVLLDLQGVEGRTLRVRVDGPPGLWAIDRAVVAFDIGEPVQETRILLSRAVAEHDEADLTALLRRADGRRHSLRPRTDSVLLAFDAPPRRPGFHRTVLAEATGYYNVIVPADGDPQREALRRLTDEPGAVARFALERIPRLAVAPPR